MAWGKKKESLSLSDAEDALKNPRALRGMSDKELKDLQRRVKGKTNIVSDILAARADAKSGRSTGGVGKAPEPRKGRSMWGKDTPLK